MEIVIASSADEAATIAADAIERLLTECDRPTLGLATGSSPLPTYRELIDRRHARRISFADTRAVLLDEYVGLPTGHPQSYRRFIERELTDHLDIADNALHGPDGTADNRNSAGEYDELLATEGGVDLQLLGIGGDGHIGFNEPGSSLASRTRLKTLTHSTRRDNARFFGDDVDAVPRHVITQGIGTILEAHHLVLLASGAAKSEPIARAVEGPVTAMVPASAMQLHPHATVILDGAAAAALANADYYREAFEHKPEWQHI
ncbi:MAG: glucosamine-6-phosphate deaminase [Ilumatobacteraceae bacterium]